MKATLILAEALSMGPGGTLSMLHAGIAHWNPEAFPAEFRGTLVTVIDTEPEDAGEYDIRLNMTNRAGNEVAPPLQTVLPLPKRVSQVFLPSELLLLFPGPDDIEFVLRIDDEIAHKHVFAIGEAIPKEGGKDVSQ